MPALQMLITDAGLDAIVDAQTGGTAEVLIDSIGLSETPFVLAPTLTEVPFEIKRLDTVSGIATAPNIIHIAAYDPDIDTYDITGFGLYDSDGTLIAVYSSEADPILSKASLATSLFAVDIVLAADVAAVIEFGDALFINPPASETVAGVVKLSTEEMADAGEDEQTAMTPAMVQRMIDNALRNKITIWSGAIADIPDGWALCDGTGGTPDLTDKFVVGAGGAYPVGGAGGSTHHDHGGQTGGHALTEAEMPSHRHSNGVTDQSGVAFNHGTLAAAPGTANSMATNSNNGVTEGYTGNTGDGLEHSHTISEIDHRPPYYALAFIMKV